MNACVINVEPLSAARKGVRPPADKHTAKSAAIRKKISALVDEFAALQFEEQMFETDNTVIPPSGKVIDGAELDNMVQASLDGWLTTGRFNDAFEKRLAQYLGVQHVLTTNSGSSANLLAFMALTSPKLGDRAIKR